MEPYDQDEDEVPPPTMFDWVVLGVIIVGAFTLGALIVLVN